MRKGSDVLGKPIVAFDSGARFAHVKDLIFDQDSNQLLALLTSDGGWLSDIQIIPFQGIQAIGLDAVIAPSENVVVRASQAPEIKRILEQNNVLKGTRIMTTDGRNLGRMIDLYFDEQTGVIEGYEVSGGLFADAYSGRSFVPSPHTLSIGEHVAFVPSEVADLMEEQIGGIKAAVLTAGEKIQGAAQETSSKLQEASRTAVTSMTNAIIDSSEQKAFTVGRTAEWPVTTSNGLLVARGGQVVTSAIAESAEQLGVLDELYRATGGRIREQILQKAETAAAGFAIEQSRGRRVHQIVRSRTGFIVAAPGQIVTDTVLERAKQYRTERDLLGAVGLSTNAAIRSQVNGTTVEAGDRFSSTTQLAGTQVYRGTEQVKQNVRSLWGQIKQTATGIQERSIRTVEEQRVKSALGRPVTRVILDQSDHVILNTGELITHHAIESARQADTLEVLLGSVYTQTPQFSKAEMSAPEAGTASLTASH